MNTEEGGVYRYSGGPLIAYTVYAQLARSLFFSGSSEPNHAVGRVFTGPNNSPGRILDDRTWEELT